MIIRRKKSLTCLVCGSTELFIGCYCHKHFKERRNNRDRVARAFIPKGKIGRPKKKEIRYSTMRVPKCAVHFVYGGLGL